MLCRADHAFAQKSVLRWSDLTGEKLVGLGPESGTGALMAQPGVTSDLSSDTMPVLSPAVRDAVAAGIPAAKTVLARAQKAMRAEEKVLRSLDPNASSAEEGSETT